MMRKTLWLLLLTFCFISVEAQHDTSLVNRLNATLQFTKVMDLEKILDYTYPKLFTIATREQMLDVLKNTFETDEYNTELDSLKIDTIFPVFTINSGSFTKVRHSMLMKMVYKEPFDTADKEGTEMLVTMMEAQFGKGNVRFDPIKNSLNIFMHPDMVAIKDNLSPEWTFVNLDEDNPAILNMLFSKEVIAKLREFK
jgi:hypothetical protein